MDTAARQMSAVATKVTVHRKIIVARFASPCASNRAVRTGSALRPTAANASGVTSGRQRGTRLYPTFASPSANSTAETVPAHPLTCAPVTRATRKGTGKIGATLRCASLATMERARDPGCASATKVSSKRDEGMEPSASRIARIARMEAAWHLATACATSAS